MNALAAEIPALLVPQRPPFVPGVFRGMPAEMYHAIEAMSSGGAKKMLQSPAHFRLMRDQPTAPTPEMEFGTVVHDGVLEPAAFSARVACWPNVDKRTKLGRETCDAFAAENIGKIILTQADLDRATRCIGAVLEHPAARKLLDGAEVETSLFWHDARYGVPCKARIDAVNHGGQIDLKTTRNAEREAFARQAANLLYHVQAAHYFSGAEHCYDATPEFWAYICVESEPPHAVACYTLAPNAIQAGGHLMDVALERYRDALAAGRWPGYPDTIEQLVLPKWATTFGL